MTMARYSGVVQDQAGNIITNAKIEVRREQPGQPLAALKSDRDGATPLVNPFNAEADGSFAFHVAGGAYKIRAYVGPSGAPTFEAPPRRYVGIGLGSETDSVAGGAPFAIVRVVATANVTIASALEAGDTLDGVTLVAGDFILLTAQTDPAENGVYEVPSSGAASRAAAFSTYDSMPGCYFSVMEGTAGADKLYRCTSNRGGMLETDAIVISEFSAGGGASAVLGEYLITDFGSESTATFQAALDQIITDGGGRLIFPEGDYTLTAGVVYDISAVASRFGSRLHLVGMGAGTSISLTGVADTAFTYIGNPSQVESYLRFEKVRFTGSNTSGSKGLDISAAAFVSSDGLIVEAFDYCMDCTDVEQAQFSNSNFRWGIHGVRFNAAVSATSANSLNFLNCAIANNTTWGLSVTNGNAVNYLGGSIQYNGAAGGGSGQWGAKFVECGDGYGTVTLIGVAIEGNGGLGDIISDQTTNPVAFNIIGCGFARPSSSSYATNFLTLLGSNAASTYALSGNRFAGFGTYTPNAGRPYIGITNTSAYISDNGSNIYGSATEQPAWAGSATFSLKTVIAGALKALANSAIGGAIGNAVLNIIVPNNAGTSNAIRFIDDGAASSSTSNNSYGVGVNPSSGAMVFTAGNAGSFQMLTANTQRFALDASGNAIFSGGYVKSSSALGVGYSAGAGGSVTQATSKSTGVTLNKASGAITMNAAALAAATIVSFVLTDSSIAAGDVLVLNHISGGTPGAYGLNARCAAGSATIDVRNNTAGSLSEAIVIEFALIKAVTT